MTDRSARILFVASLAVGLVLRLAFVPTAGFPTDVGTFMAWGDRLRELGPGQFYSPDYFSDYPPGFLYVLWLVASVLGGMPQLVAKALSIPFDLAIGVALYAVVSRVARERTAAVAASLYLLNPALVLAGPYWGQVDAAGTLPLLLALVAAAFGRFTLAGALAGVAFMVKPQFGVPGIAVFAAAAFDVVLNRRWQPLLRSVGAAVIAIAALAVPFGMGLFGDGGLFALINKAAATYEYSSLYAFNLWAVVSDFWKPDGERIFGVEMRYWSALLFGLAVIAVLFVLWRGAPRRRRWGDDPGRDLGFMLAVGALLTLAFYFLPTRVHERYLFPLFALMAPLAAAYARIRYAYLAFAAFFFLSVFYAFTRYPQTNTLPPDLLEATLYQRVGTQLLSVAGIALAAVVTWWWARGEARDVSAVEALAGGPVEAAPALTPAVPEALRPGRGPSGRDLRVAFLLALVVLLTRGYRLDWPRDMYFDEVYHARTAMEMLAGREYYEWTHPHLAKEVMAASIVLFGDVRAVGTASDPPPDAEAFAVDGDGSRAYARGGVVTAIGPSGARADIGTFDGTARFVALTADAAFVATLDHVASFGRTPETSNGRVPEAPLGNEPRALAVADGRVFVATSSALLVLSATDLAPQLTVPVVDTVALAPMSDGHIVYAVAADGTVRSVSYESGLTLRTWNAGAAVSTLAVLPNACPAERAADDRCDHLFLGDASEPVLHGMDLETGGRDDVPLSNWRTAPFTGPPSALALSPLTKMVWVLGRDGAVIVEPHGTSPFAAVHEAAGARFLGVDDVHDEVVAAGLIPAVRIDAGRIAFAWRLPGVIAGAILAFFLFLLARRLFRAPLVAYALGTLVVVDGAMFAQSRIGMNDIYTAAGIVVGWYFVVTALSSDARRPWLWVLLGGIALGLALAAKWAAGPALLAVGLVSLFVTARAFVNGKPGQGGAFDLLRWRGANALYLLLCFVAVPIAIYLVSYIPWLGLGHGIFQSENGSWSLIELQKQMYAYHSQLTAPHPAGSPWWAWPLDLKPVYWEYEPAGTDRSTYIYDAGNLVTWWAGIPAMLWFGWLAFTRRAWNVAVVVLAFLTQYAEWLPVTRVLFQYHFFTALPFYLLAVAAALALLWRRADRRRWLDGAAAVAVFVAGVVASAWLVPVALPVWVGGAGAGLVALGWRPERRPLLAGVLVAGVVVGGALWFVWFYPWLSALPIPGSLAAYYVWLPTWQYGCQFYPTFRCT
ncbi:MAG: phospholipid carrier-dependent glycosyltransferase [Chloroflexi bacterium]|nr:MAG: phospholipid carrier-dependent glycosyltransferase [Chloroflexota bacterium]